MPEMPRMREMTAIEFVRRIKSALTDSESQSRFTFFLGAGCSISSGIPDAGTLVRDYWLPRLKEIKTGTRDNLREWIVQTYPEYTPETASSFYKAVIEDLFLNPEDRQQEIEKWTNQNPGFGYAVLAQLLTDKSCGKHCNIVLTTNFDDMVQDALYLYSNQKPLVIVHESLITFVKISRTRPLIIKIHGDARLAPKNTGTETETSGEVTKVLKSILSETGLIFIGYGGNDKNITDILRELDSRSLPSGIYWVNEKMPSESLQTWFKWRNVSWVKHLDFDELMLLFYREFGLKPPEKEKFDKIFKTYFDNFKKLSDKIDKKPASPEKKILEKAIQTAAGDFEDWWAVQLEAKKYEGTKPEKADEIYRKGIEQFPESPELLGNYGVFLHLGAKDNEKTEKYYKRSLELDPNDATVLGNYGLFLYQMRKDYDRAERYYEQALKNDPNNAIVLGNYANLLHLIRKDYQKAEEYYKRSLENDPDDADFLGNYATFLYKVRKDNVRVEEYYKRSLEKDPNSSFQSANYGDFLLSQGRYKDGMQLIEKALASQEIKSGTKIECHFYLYAHSKDLKEESRHLSELKKSLLLGDRSPGWDLQQNVDRAIKDGHPEPEFLKALAKVIADEMKIEELEKFEVWRKA